MVDLIIDRKRFHVAVQFYMVCFFKTRLCISQFEDTGDLEIAVFISHMAPGDQMPAEGVEDQADGLNAALADLLVVVFIIDIEDIS